MNLEARSWEEKDFDKFIETLRDVPALKIFFFNSDDPHPFIIKYAKPKAIQSGMIIVEGKMSTGKSYFMNDIMMKYGSHQIQTIIYNINTYKTKIEFIKKHLIKFTQIKYVFIDMS